MRLEIMILECSIHDKNDSSHAYCKVVSGHQSLSSSVGSVIDRHRSFSPVKVCKITFFFLHKADSKGRGLG